jgi:hypothetical protein
VLTVRRAEALDVAALAALADEAYQVYVHRIGRPPAPMTADYAEAVRGDLTWVAAEGRGIGARLLACAEEQARALGRDEIRLYTNEAMTENLDYYPGRRLTETHRAEQDGFRRVFFGNA